VANAQKYIPGREILPGNCGLGELTARGEAQQKQVPCASFSARGCSSCTARAVVCVFVCHPQALRVCTAVPSRLFFPVGWLRGMRRCTQACFGVKFPVFRAQQ
jgi:hypothetical protein